MSMNCKYCGTVIMEDDINYCPDCKPEPKCTTCGGKGFEVVPSDEAGGNPYKAPCPDCTTKGEINTQHEQITILKEQNAQWKICLDQREGFLDDALKDKVKLKEQITVLRKALEEISQKGCMRDAITANSALAKLKGEDK